MRVLLVTLNCLFHWSLCVCVRQCLFYSLLSLIRYKSLLFFIKDLIRSKCFLSFRMSGRDSRNVLLPSSPHRFRQDIHWISFR